MLKFLAGGTAAVLVSWYQAGLENKRSLVRTQTESIFIPRFIIVILTGFIPLSLLSYVWTIVVWESSQWLVKNIVRTAGKKENMVRCTGR